MNYQRRKPPAYEANRPACADAPADGRLLDWFDSLWEPLVPGHYRADPAKAKWKPKAVPAGKPAPATQTEGPSVAKGLFDETAVAKGATLSACGLYRYQLWRRWDSALPAVNWIMLNPSTADASEDDPTIRRCVGFAKAWGYGGIVVTNLFAFRATDPRDMKKAADPVGPENDDAIVATAAGAGLVVCAWGAHGVHLGRSGEVLAMLFCGSVKTTALKLTSAGEPCHPLYLPGELRPFPYEPQT